MNDSYHELQAFEVIKFLDGMTTEQRETVWATAAEYKDNPRFPNDQARFSAALHELGWLDD